MTYTTIAPGYLGCGPHSQSEMIHSWTFSQTVLYTFRAGEGACTKDEMNLLNSVLTAYVSHGDTPASSMVPKIAADLGGTAEQMFLSTLSASLGKTHLGALYECMRFLEKYRDKNVDAVIESVSELLQRGERVPGFGHRVHKVPYGDPRAVALKHILMNSGVDAKDWLMKIHAIERKLTEAKPHAYLDANIDGAAAAALLSLNLTPDIATLIVAAGRGADWFRIYIERRNRFHGSHPKMFYIGTQTLDECLSTMDLETVAAWKAAFEKRLTENEQRQNSK